MVGFSGNAGKCGWAGRAALVLVLMGLSTSLGAQQSAAQAQNAVAAALEVVPNVIRFADVPGVETYTQTVRLANLGKTAMQVKKISMGAASFGVSGFAAPLVLLPGSSANVTVSYHPKAAEHLAVEMRIVTSADAAPVT